MSIAFALIRRDLSEAPVANKEPRRKQRGIGEQYQIMIRTPQAAGN
jgi:hypothetical protein